MGSEAVGSALPGLSDLLPNTYCWKRNFPLNPLIFLLVGWSVSRSVLIPPHSKKTQEVALPCSHRSTCCISQRRSQDIFISSIIIFMHWLYKFLSSADQAARNLASPEQHHHHHRHNSLRLRNTFLPRSRAA